MQKLYKNQNTSELRFTFRNNILYKSDGKYWMSSGNLILSFKNKEFSISNVDMLLPKIFNYLYTVTVNDLKTQLTLK